MASAPVTSEVTVPLGQRSYPVVIGCGLIAPGATIERIAAQIADGKVAVVAQAPVIRRWAPLFMRSLHDAGVRSELICIPNGEGAKSPANVTRLCRQFVAHGLDRRSTVIALGGGVTGDLAGFAAASYLRGIQFMQAPTTLLAQVDAAIGGKTGINLPEGKNLIGAIWQPTLVVSDVDTLATLPRREVRSALAEVIKYGVIADADLFRYVRNNMDALLLRDPAALTEVVTRSCRIKSGVVAEDETEQGRRAVLNFGHTVAHALESVTRYRIYRHGEAVSIGMVAAAAIGVELGITAATDAEALDACLLQAGLPVTMPQLPVDELLEACFRDKKTVDRRLRFVLAPSIGKCSVVAGVPVAAVRSAITLLQRPPYGALR
ncbi:MAG: 3-dehydroquinate synthase [Armatimonadetes bacterium]|nr:3-dehydroquinate synthase [Armatimonadota bacterium]MDE2206457.1 3-dehydroquinate synthase [Armatimonadota bacterium]